MIQRITKEFSFEAAHALDHHQGKCHDIHGHSYHLRITIVGPINTKVGHPECGMVIDFGNLKALFVNHIEPLFDHRLILHERSPFKGIEIFNSRVRFVEYQPTCENMLSEIVQLTKEHLTGATIHSALLRETPTSYAEWYEQDNRK